MDAPFFPGSPAQTIERVRETIDAHCQDLRRIGLADGFLGLSVFYYLYGEHRQNSAYARSSAYFFDWACDGINADSALRCPTDFASLGLITHYLNRAGVLTLDPDYFLREVDAFLLEGLQQALDQGYTGTLEGGALGHGLYYLHRSYYQPGAFTEVLQELGTAFGRATRGAAGSAAGFQTPADLSLARGPAGWLLFLAAAAEQGASPSAQLMGHLEGFVEELWRQRCRLSTFPYVLSFQEGDLGLGYALLRAGQVFQRPGWEQQGIALLDYGAQLCLQQAALTLRAGLRTGAAGNALAFDRIHRLTGRDLFARAADLSYHHTLRLAPQETGWGPPAVWHQLGFESGLLGVAATLMRALHRDRLDFDRLIWLL